MNFYPSISQHGGSEPFGLQVSRGQILGHQSILVFGYNPDLDQAEESIWADGGIVPTPMAAGVMKVSSTSASDTSAGTGARTVYVAGIIGDYTEASEIITLNGQTAVNTVNEYRHINDFYVLTVGSGGVNAGTINIGTGIVTAGVPAVLYDLMYVGLNRRTTAHYMVPLGYTAYLQQGIFTAGQETGSTGVVGKLNLIDVNGVKRAVAVTALNNGSVNYSFNLPVPVTEKCCIGASAIGSANNNLVSAMFGILLIKNEVIV